MGNNYFINPLIFLIQTLLGLYETLVLLRFLLQLVQADFYNPISQLIVAMTAPMLRLLREVIPNLGGMDMSALVLAWFIKSLELFLIILLLGGGIHVIGAVLLWAIPELVESMLNIFLIAILIQVVFSWISYPGINNPIASLASSLAEPIMEMVQNFVPVTSGIDFSPMVASIFLVLLEMLLLPPLKAFIGSPF